MKFEYSPEQLKLFFDSLRRDRRVFPNGFAQSAVIALEKIIKATMHLSRAEAAYVMATPYHEVGPALVPVRENMNYSEAAIRRTWRNRPEAVKYARQPENLANSVYANRMGNGDFASGDGWKNRGGGLVQLTGADMYKKFGVDAETILDLDVSVDVLVRGMERGMFTGRALSDYNLPAAFRSARSIINADVGLNGSKIATYAHAFLEALNAMGLPALPAIVQPMPEQPVNPITVEPEGSSEVPLAMRFAALEHRLDAIQYTLEQLMLTLKERL